MRTLHIVAVAAALLSLLATARVSAAAFCGGVAVTIEGTAGDDIIDGTAGNDVISGLGGNDTIHGLDGDDVICGGDGNDTIYGDAGTDIIYGEAGDDYLDGGSNPDLLGGGPGMDTLVGGTGDDILNGDDDVDDLDGGDGDDRIHGGAGDDILKGGNGDFDILWGDAGNDQIDGGPGVLDEVSYSTATGPVNVDLSVPSVSGADSDTLTGIESVTGSPYDDVLRGTAARNEIHGGDGADTIYGGDFVDYLYGDGGNDHVYGEGGNDRVYGGDGDDTVDGGDGNDGVYGGYGNDTILGGAGNDGLNCSCSVTVTPSTTTWSYTPNAAEMGGDDILDGGPDEDCITDGDGQDIMRGGDGADVIHARITPDTVGDTIEGGAANDIIYGSAGDDSIDGGSGYDTLEFAASQAPVTVDLAAGTAIGQGNDTLVSIENILGTDGDDVLLGDAYGNALRGLGGNDYIDGRGGGDRIGGYCLDNSKVSTCYGETGDDTWIGGDGSDTFGDFAGGNKTIDGGAGAGDTLTYFGSDYRAVVDLAAGTASTWDSGGVQQGSSTISGIENVTGSTFDDEISGDAGANKILGGDGNDVLNGDDGDDQIDGESGDDQIDGGPGLDSTSYATAPGAVIVNLVVGTASGYGSDTLAGIENVTGSPFDDDITGDASDNQLDGADGDDIIHGGDGTDYLIGNPGNDQLYGEAGDDQFVADGGSSVVGNDLIDGGPGDDTAFLYSLLVQAVQADLVAGTATGGVGNDTLVSVENLIGSFYDDVLLGDGGANHLQGFFGDDFIDGRGGADLLDGGYDPYVPADPSDGYDTCTRDRPSDVLISCENVLGPGLTTTTTTLTAPTTTLPVTTTTLAVPTTTLATPTTTLAAPTTTLAVPTTTLATPTTTLAVPTTTVQQATTTTTTTSTTTTSTQTTTTTTTTTLRLESFVGYKVRATDPRGDRLPKNCNMTLAESVFDAPENYTVSSTAALMLPAAIDGDALVDSRSHLIGYRLTEAVQGIGAPAGPPGRERFPRGLRHNRRSAVQISNVLGGDTVDTLAARLLLVPARKDLTAPPDSDLSFSVTDHFKCFVVRTTKGVAPTGLRQVLALDQFAGGRSKLCAAGSPRRPGAPCSSEATCGGVQGQTSLCNAVPHAQLGDSVLYDVLRPRYLCVPVAKTNIDTTQTDGKGQTRSTSCAVAPSPLQRSEAALTCYKARRAKRVYDSAIATELGVSAGAKLTPRQSLHSTESPFVRDQLPAPRQLRTIRDTMLCLRSSIVSAGTPVFPAPPVVVQSVSNSTLAP